MAAFVCANKHFQSRIFKKVNSASTSTAEYLHATLHIPPSGFKAHIHRFSRYI